MSLMIINSEFHDIRERRPREGQSVRVNDGRGIITLRYTNDRFVGHDRDGEVAYANVRYWQPVVDLIGSANSGTGVDIDGADIWAFTKLLDSLTVTDEDIAAIEERIGYSPAAWDCVDPKELVTCMLAHFASRGHP